MISLVVPVYNMEKYLSRCMNTLLEQKGNYEIILVNDGSTDNSRELCNRYVNEYPDLVRVVHKQNGGLSSARNAGMDAAKGEYVIFPDPDDWVEPNYVERLIELQNRYQPDLLCVGYYIDYDDKCIPANDSSELVVMNGLEAQKALLLPPKMSGFAWNKLYHMDIIREHGLRFLDDVGTTEDLDFAFRYLTYCQKVCFDPESRVYHYYQRKGAATHSGFSKKKMDAIHTYEKIIESSNDNELVRAAQEEICNTAINLVWSYRNSNANDKASWIRIQQYVRKYLRYYCTSSHFGWGRKIQAVLACFIPGVYVWLKNRVSREV